MLHEIYKQCHLKFVNKRMKDYQNKSAIVKHEPVCVQKLTWLLNKLKAEEDADWYLRLEAYQKKMKMKKVTVKYTYNDDLAKLKQGRIYAVDGCSLQMFKRDIRNFLAVDWGWDIDMVNAHPVILLQTAEKHDWHSPVLKHIVQHREEVLSKIQEAYNVDRASAKVAVLRQMYLGSFEAWANEHADLCNRPEEVYVEVDKTACGTIKALLEGLRSELMYIASNICQLKPELVKVVNENKPGANDRSIKSSVLSIFAQTEENRILAELDRALQARNRQLAVNIYDGGIVMKDPPDENEFPIEILRFCESQIRQKTGYNIRLEVKPMASKYTEEYIKKTQGQDFNKLNYSQAYAVLKEGYLMYDQQKELFERFNFKVNAPSCFITEVEGTNIRSTEDMVSAHRHFKCLDENGIEKKFIPQWLDDKNIKEYRTFDFLPPPLRCPDDTYNLYTGFAAEKIQLAGGTQGAIEPFINHLSIVVNHDAKSIHYLTSIFAQIIQEPGHLPGIAVVLISKEGAGKNLLLNTMRDVIGKEFYYETADPEKDVFARFSVARANRFMLNMDETSQRVTRTFAQQMKQFITAETQNYEKKNLTPKEIRNCCRIFITSNSEVPVCTDENGRRYAIFRCSDEMIGNREYFTEYVKYTRKPENLKAIFEYLKSYNYTGINWIQDRPVTEQTKVVVASNCHYAMEWLQAVVVDMEMYDINEYTCKSEKVRDNLETFCQIRLRKGNDFCVQKKLNEIAKVWNDIDGLSKQKTGPTRTVYYTFNRERLIASLKKKHLLQESAYMLAMSTGMFDKTPSISI